MKAGKEEPRGSVLNSGVYTAVYIIVMAAALTTHTAILCVILSGEFDFTLFIIYAGC